MSPRPTPRVPSGDPKVVASRLGRSLRSARQRAGWSRESLAHHSGLSAAAIAQIESGRRQEVRVSSLVALSRALEVSIDYLAGGAGPPSLLRHRTAIYDSDEQYLAVTVPFIAEGITRSDCVLVVTAERSRELLRGALGDDATSVEFVDASDWYRSLDGASAEYRSLVRERVDHGPSWVRIVGEPVWEGRSDAELTDWIRYESLINLSLASSPASIVCTYDARAVSEDVLAGARRTHPELAAGGDVTPNAAYREPEEFLLGLA